MAKRKKGRSRRRSRVGASSMLNPKSPVVKLAAVAAGYFLGDEVNSMINSILPASMMTTATAATATTAATSTASGVAKAIPYVEIGLGGLLLLKGKSSLIKTAAGGILAGAGLKTVLTQMGVVKGYQSVPVIGRRRLAGYQQTPVIGKVPAQLQGTTPAQLQGYRVNGYTPNGSGVGVMGSLYTNGSGLNQHDSSGYMSN